MADVDLSGALDVIEQLLTRPTTWLAGFALLATAGLIAPLLVRRLRWSPLPTLLTLLAGVVAGAVTLAPRRRPSADPFAHRLRAHDRCRPRRAGASHVAGAAQPRAVHPDDVLRDPGLPPSPRDRGVRVPRPPRDGNRAGVRGAASARRATSSPTRSEASSGSCWQRGGCP